MTKMGEVDLTYARVPQAAVCVRCCSNEADVHVALQCARLSKQIKLELFGFGEHSTVKKPVPQPLLFLGFRIGQSSKSNAKLAGLRCMFSH